MSKKKSYMNKENILAEGFFSKLFKVLSLSKSDENKLKKSKKIRKSLFDLNNA